MSPEFVPMDLGSAKEPELVPEGVYDLVAGQWRDHVNKRNNKKSLAVPLVVNDPPAGVKAADILHFMSYPREDDTAQAREFKILQIKRFLHHFGVPYEGNGFNPNDIPGARAQTHVIQQEQQDEDGKGTGVIRNAIRLPPLPKEA